VYRVCSLSRVGKLEPVQRMSMALVRCALDGAYLNPERPGDFKNLRGTRTSAKSTSCPRPLVLKPRGALENERTNSVIKVLSRSAYTKRSAFAARILLSVWTIGARTVTCGDV